MKIYLTYAKRAGDEHDGRKTSRPHVMCVQEPSLMVFYLFLRRLYRSCRRRRIDRSSTVGIVHSIGIYFPIHTT